jgi:hypothetical protein
MMTAAKRFTQSVSQVKYAKQHTYLGVIFCVSSMQSDGFKVEATVKVDSGHDVPTRN